MSELLMLTQIQTLDICGCASWNNIVEAKLLFLLLLSAPNREAERQTGDVVPSVPGGG